MITIRPMTDGDAEAVLRIYQVGLDGGVASFETTAPAWEQFSASRLPLHRFVAVVDGVVAGWIAVSATSARPAYAGVVEHSVYVDPAAQGRGIALALMRELIASTEAAGIWTIQSAVFRDNEASLRLHERAGFRVIGIRERVGRRRDGWQDTVLIERRSSVAGVD